MTKKLILILNLFIILIFVYGCSAPNDEIFPTTIPLEQSIKEIIISKGSNYDFLNDELFLNKVDEFANTIIKTNTGTDKHYTIGNLDDDNVPELIIFVERDPKDIEDKGGLGVYSFNGEKYELLDKIEMNYDNGNYLLKVGKVSPSKNGILLSNHVGAHSTATYGFILDNGKLKSILNDKKVNLISVYPNNHIEDIDNDGILEFSIFTNDPESTEQNPEESNKLILWYKWDEKDSAKIVKIEKEVDVEVNSTQKEEEFSFEQLDTKPTLSFLINNKDKYSKTELTSLLDEYIDGLAKNILNSSNGINDLFKKYQDENNYNLLMDKYDLSIERLNSIEYLKREKVLQSEPELKEHLIKHIEMGYKLDSSEGMYYYIIDYQNFINYFNGFITNQYRDCLKIKSMGSNEPYLLDNSFIITRDRLAERIVAIERFKLTYPYSKHIEEIDSIYKSYINVFLYGTTNTPNYDLDTNKFSEGSIAVFNSTIEKYPESYLAEIIQELLDKLTLNLGVLNDEIKNNINNMIY